MPALPRTRMLAISDSEALCVGDGKSPADRDLRPVYRLVCAVRLAIMVPPVVALYTIGMTCESCVLFDKLILR
jgi:hypothetical protein